MVAMVVWWWRRWGWHVSGDGGGVVVMVVDQPGLVFSQNASRGCLRGTGSRDGGGLGTGSHRLPNPEPRNPSPQSQARCHNTSRHRKRKHVRRTCGMDRPAAAAAAAAWTCPAGTGPGPAAAADSGCGAERGGMSTAGHWRTHPLSAKLVVVSGSTCPTGYRTTQGHGAAANDARTGPRGSPGVKGGGRGEASGLQGRHP